MHLKWLQEKELMLTKSNNLKKKSKFHLCSPSYREQEYFLGIGKFEREMYISFPHFSDTVKIILFEFLNT